MKKSIQYIILATVSALITFAVTRLGGKPFGHDIKFVFNFFYGFLIILFARRFNYSTGYFISTLFAPIIISFLILNNAIHWRFYSLTTPSTLAFFLGISFALIALASNKRRWRYFVILISVVINLFVTFNGYNLWVHKLNYGSFLGKQNIAISSIKLKNIQYQEVSLEVKENIYMLDFWSTSCAICIEQFPLIQELYNKNKNTNKLKIYLVNVPYTPEDYSYARQILERRKINVPLLYFSDTSTKLLGSKYQVYAFPTILIIRNNKIIHVGDIHSAIKRLKKLSL